MREDSRTCAWPLSPDMRRAGSGSIRAAVAASDDHDQAAEVIPVLETAVITPS
jgi:hypothetical protein